MNKKVRSQQTETCCSTCSCPAQGWHRAQAMSRNGHPGVSVPAELEDQGRGKEGKGQAGDFIPLSAVLHAGDLQRSQTQVSWGWLSAHRPWVPPARLCQEDPCGAFGHAALGPA